ncbi:hypothetical protein SDC9_121199 [bioreactor metagenome]|uniref:Uncharacterized protein n=1 Tax=bioreactor metagenome TaxID=1076179 RepID=A0A645CBB1_9ZZZZ
MGECVFRLLNQRHCAAGLVVPVETLVRSAHRRQVFFPVAQKVPPLQQLLLLAGAQLRPLQLLDLKAQAVHLPSLFGLVHPEGVHPPAQLRHGIIGPAVLAQRIFQPPKAVQIRAVLLLVQKLLSVVLAVDVQEVRPQRAQLGYRNRPAVDAAKVFAVHVDLPLDHQKAVLIRFRAALRKTGQISRYAGELRADHRLLAAGADQIPGGPAPQHRAHGVDHNGFARARLTGECVEARAKLNVRLLDDRNIFNVQQFQHGSLPLLSV